MSDSRTDMIARLKSLNVKFDHPKICTLTSSQIAHIDELLDIYQGHESNSDSDFSLSFKGSSNLEVPPVRLPENSLDGYSKVFKDSN